jgi:hypothetical protein
MCGCNNNSSSRLKNFNLSPTKNKVISSKISRANIYSELHKKADQKTPLPENQNKLSKNAEIIRKALLEKHLNKNNNKNNNKKFFI